MFKRPYLFDYIVTDITTNIIEVYINPVRTRWFETFFHIFRFVVYGIII